MNFSIRCTYLVVGIKTTGSASVTEREAEEDLLCELPGEHRRTLGADKAYDTTDFVAGCRELRVTPHVAQNDTCSGGTAIDGRTTSHAGYLVSMRKRKMIETKFGWVKQYGSLRRMMFRRIERVNAVVTFAADTEYCGKSGAIRQVLLRKSFFLKRIGRIYRTLIIFSECSLQKKSPLHLRVEIFDYFNKLLGCV